MTIWLSSDHHWGHANIIKFCDRPYKNVDEMNRDLVKRWNQVVKPEDIVYYLGDFSLSTYMVKLILPRLNGTKHLAAMGNHDRIHPVHKKKKENQDIYLQSGFETISQEMMLSITPELTVKLHHLPYSTYEGDKYAAFRPKDEGHWLLHGHIHNNGWLKKGKMINVSIDVWNYAPVALPEILHLMTQEDVLFNKHREKDDI